jgi:hypothetical protein
VPERDDQGRTGLHPCETKPVTGTKILQYLGLRHAPGTERTSADRIWTIVMMIVIFLGLFFTRNFDFWFQIAVVGTAAVVLGVLGAAVLAAIATR